MAARCRPHTAQRKAALVIGVDEFVTDGRRLREHTRPAEHVVKGVHVDPRKDEEWDSHLQEILSVKMAAVLE